MRPLLLAVLLLLAAQPVLANVSPMILPDLSFPTPAPAPDAVTRDCTATLTRPCQ